MGAIKTMKEVESALPQKKEINYVRALDKEGNPILISKDDLAQVVGELMEKYVNLETFKDFDDKLFSAQNMTTIYTFADLTDYDPKIHPFTRGCLEVFRYGNHSTLQRVTDYKGKIFVRAINAGSSTWSQWVQV